MNPLRLAHGQPPQQVTDVQMILVVGGAAIVVVIAGLMDGGHILAAVVVLSAGLAAGTVVAVRAYLVVRAVNDAEARTIPRPWTDDELKLLKSASVAEPPLLCGPDTGELVVDLKRNTVTVRPKLTPYPRTDRDGPPTVVEPIDDAVRIRWAVIAADFHGETAAELDRISSLMADTTER